MDGDNKKRHGKVRAKHQYGLQQDKVERENL